MRNVVRSAMLAAAFAGASVSAAAQTIQATAPAGPQLYKGLTMKAEQHCPRFPGQGVIITVETLNQSGTGGSVSALISCWGTWARLRNDAYRGSIAMEGNSVKLSFSLPWDMRSGANLSGTWQTDAAGRPMLVFKTSELRVEKNVYTDELVFR